MWREPDEIRADLDSQDPDRLSKGLRDLEELMDGGVFVFPLPPLQLHLLSPFGANLSDEDQLRMLRLVNGYQAFDPPQSDAEKYRKIAALGCRWGDHMKALQAALIIKGAEEPVAATELALDAIASGIVDSAKSLEGAQYFVSLLLDAYGDIRRVTLDRLASWPRKPPYSDIVAFILPQLDEDESSRLR